MQKCKYCDGPLVKRRVTPHVGLFCVICQRWQQWVGKNDVKFTEIPFEEAADYLDTDNIREKSEMFKKLYASKEPADKLMLNSLYGRMACDDYPTSDADDSKPPWED